MMIHILLLRVVFLTFTSGQEYVIERLGGREGRIAPALGIKCSTAELKILNEMVEECLEIALTLEVDDFVDSVDELNDGDLVAMDSCSVVEASMECTNIRAACMDDRTLREFKDSMFDVYTMLGLGLEKCSMTQEYLTSGRAMQLVMESVCDPWQVFEVDWNYRYCISTIVRAASIAIKDVDGGILLDILDIEDDMLDSEFEDLGNLYSGQKINFCDFSQFVLACGEHLHPCYRDNVIEVEILKFLNTMYWLSEYDQPNESWSHVAANIAVEDVVELADYSKGDICKSVRKDKNDMYTEDNSERFNEL